MLRTKLKLILLLLIIALVFMQLIVAGTTGKITGTVTDQKTGAPIVGANIIVEGTTLGSATDQNGQFTVLYAPPGNYTVRVSVIGYKEVKVTDVIVHIDQTTRIDFVLEPEVLPGEEIVVVAERKIIKPDVATSTVAVPSSDISVLPVSNVNDIISLEAGISGMSIRGGYAQEILFLLDGIALRDPRNNEPVTKVPLSAVKEISIQRGGFNAEYGQVQSGIINVVTVEGDRDRYSGNIEIKIVPPAPKYFRTDGIPDVHDPNSYWMRPYLDDAVCWTGTTQGEPYTDLNGNGKWDEGEPFEDLNGDGIRTYWDKYMQMQYPSFVGWNAVSDQLLADDDPTNDLTPRGAQRVFMWETRKKQPNNLADYDIDAGFGGPVPLISKKLGDLRFFTSYRRHRDVLLWPQADPDYIDWDWTFQLTSDIAKNTKLRFSSLIGHIRTLAENWNYGFYPHWPHEIAAGTGGYQMFNTFSDWAWSRANIGHRSFSMKLTQQLSPRTYYEISVDHFYREYDTNPTSLRDTTKKHEILPGYWVDEYPFGYWPYEIVGVTPEIKDGIQASLARDFSKVKATTIKGDFTSQINFNNLMKFGFEFVYNDLNMDYGFIQMQSKGQTYANRVQMHNFPIRAALYIQDKLETQGFIMNVGLRLDYSHSRTDWWDLEKNAYNPYFISSQYAKYKDDYEFEMVKSKPQWQLSPRLGISHPITVNSKLFFNYGHFKQIPQYETLFRIQRSSTSALSAIGNPNLTLAKTIAYELGYDHLIFNSILIQLAAYYKDISDQQNVTTYESISGDNYIVTTSNGYRDIRGFELTIRKNTGRWFRGWINYTYQVASSGHFGPERFYEDPARQKLYNEETENFYQQRSIPTPFARANLSLFTPEDFGPNLMNSHPLGEFMVTLLLNWSEGGWTTYNPKGASGVVNNVQYVDYFDGTLRVSKTLNLKSIKIHLFCDISNLFNQMRLRDTGNQLYRQSLHLPKSEAYDNIPGNDKFGDYRRPGIPWQPIEYRAVIEGTQPPDNTVPIYYEGTTGKYWEIVDGHWQEVEKSKLDWILENKAYIYNPGPSTWWFLNPRRVTLGIRISF
ncbi:MAG: TonB-dependent receptor [Candidatus Marinimicrobia bacterium]|nr:TonB-dependent receptor [Candidatus Neomarinimicrobiota bacterium]